MIEGNSGFAYRYALKYDSMNRGHPNIDADDLLQSSLLGLVEAVDHYDPDRGYAFTTYAYWRILKYLSAQVADRHWNTLRPPKKVLRDYLQHMLDHEGIENYKQAFISTNSPYTETLVEEQDTWHILADIRRAANEVLDENELAVVESLFSDRDMNRVDSSVLDSALDKLRVELTSD